MGRWEAAALLRAVLDVVDSMSLLVSLRTELGVWLKVRTEVMRCVTWRLLCRLSGMRSRLSAARC